MALLTTTAASRPTICGTYSSSMSVSPGPLAFLTPGNVKIGMYVPMAEKYDDTTAANATFSRSTIHTIELSIMGSSHGFGIASDTG